MLMARSMTVGDSLLGEVRRNLALYAGQPHLNFPRDAIQTLYVCGDGENAVLREKLQGTLAIAVHGLDPFVKEERIDVPPQTRAGFTGAAGLLQLWAEHGAMPANFVKPREARPAASKHKKRVLVYGILGALILAGSIVLATLVQAQGREERDLLTQQENDAKKQLKDLQPEAKYLEGLKDWVDGDVSDLDEFYDLVALAPWREGLRISKVVKEVQPTPKVTKDAKDTSKDKKIADARFLVKLTIWVKVLRKDAGLVKTWMEAINRDPHCRASSPKLQAISQTTDPENALHEYTLTVEIARQNSTKYNSVFIPPAAKKW
jgi:hypothetical protein